MGCGVNGFRVPALAVWLTLALAPAVTFAQNAPWDAVVRIVEVNPVCGAHCSADSPCCTSAYNLDVVIEVEVLGALPRTLAESEQILVVALTAWTPDRAKALPKAVFVDARALGAARRESKAVGYSQGHTQSAAAFAAKTKQRFTLKLRLNRRKPRWHWSASDCPNSSELFLRADLIGESARWASVSPGGSPDTNVSTRIIEPLTQGIGRPACPRRF
jgi:hypothetical protein